MTTDTDPAVTIWQEALDTLEAGRVSLRQHTTRENGDTTMNTNAPTTKTHATQRSWVLIWTIFAALALLVVGLTLMAPAPARAIAGHHHAHPQHVSPPAPDAAKPCVYEDGSGGTLPCYWDAGSFGNGVGHSFWIGQQHRIHYLNDAYDFRVKMREAGWVRALTGIHALAGHQLCFLNVGPTTAIRCFDGYRTTA